MKQSPHHLMLTSTAVWDETPCQLSETEHGCSNHCQIVSCTDLIHVLFNRSTWFTTLKFVACWQVTD